VKRTWEPAMPNYLLTSDPLRRPCGAENVDSAPVASLANVFLGAPVAGTLAMQVHASTRKPPYGLSLINIQ